MRLPKYVEQVIEKLNICGFKAYVVGGCVRDSLLSLPVCDYDITTSATPDEIKAALCGFKIIETGIAHGTVTVIADGHHLEITTFRGEGAYSDCRHPDSVTFGGCLEDDLSRRDFTINAIAYNKTVGYVDLFGGIEDISAHLIRTVGNADTRLKEDALRILRALRFSATLNFEIEAKTKKAILENYRLLSHVSKERIFTELKRLICGKNAPDVLIEFYGVFEFVLGFSKGQDFYKKAAQTISKLNNCTFGDHLAALFLDCNEKTIRTVLTSLKSDTKTVKYVCTLTSIPNLSGLNKIAVKKLLSGYSRDKLTAATKLQLAAEKITQNDAQNLTALIDEILENCECFSLSQLAVSGTDLAALGFSGAQIGKTLDLILNKVILGHLPNEKSALLRFAKTLKK